MNRGLSTYFSEGAWGWQHFDSHGCRDHGWGFSSSEAALAAASRAGYEAQA